MIAYGHDPKTPAKVPVMTFYVFFSWQNDAPRRHGK
jgi:hypothetical protein